MQATSIAEVAHPQRSLWLHGPVLDALLGWCFLPIAVVVHFTEPHLNTVQALVGVIFLVSFAHQPLTLGLVYGDPVQRAAHRRLYTWAPLCAAALIMLGLSISLSLVAVLAGLWNAEHTLMQRYGVLRIYGRPQVRTFREDPARSRAMGWAEPATGGQTTAAGDADRATEGARA